MWVQTLKVQSRATKALVKRFIQDYFFLLICMKVLTLHKSYNDLMKTRILKSKICKMISKWNTYTISLNFQIYWSGLFAPVTRGIPWYVSKVLLRDPPLNWICRFPVKWLDTNWLVYFYAFGALILISVTFSV